MRKYGGADPSERRGQDDVKKNLMLRELEDKNDLER